MRALLCLPPLALGLGACTFPDYALLLPRPLFCDNQRLDEGESDFDCGGDCEPCTTAQHCRRSTDCRSLVCDEGTCAAPTCSDGVRNGKEADVDCGEICAPALCLTGDTCTAPEDCASAECAHGVCGSPSCHDGTKNAAETGVDCGGPSCEPCDQGGACVRNRDCTTGLCSRGKCVPTSCANGELDDSETDIDCGGSACSACAPTRTCARGRDCASGSCVAKQCAPATCSDGIANGDETDADCGGPLCDPCGDDMQCLSSRDCTSRACKSRQCIAASCSDQLLNGDETGEDCGGSCPACPAGLPCSNDEDCQSGVCREATCQAPSCEDGVLNSSETGTDCGPDCEPCDPRCQDLPIPAKETWSTEASSYFVGGDAEVPKRATDGALWSRWSTGKSQTGDEWLQVDFGQRVAFDTVLIRTGQFASDYARSFALALDDDADGASPRVIAAGPGQPELVIHLQHREVTRRLRLSQTGSDPAWWSVAELDVSCDR